MNQRIHLRSVVYPGVIAETAKSVARTATAAVKEHLDLIFDIVFPPLIAFIGTLSLIKNELFRMESLRLALLCVKEIFVKIFSALLSGVVVRDEAFVECG
jgi:hypothetical protein